MERIPGPLMSDAILRRLWTMRAGARMLADLHDRLHAIPGPEWLRQVPGDGTCLVHLDLHPLNVIMHPDRGPVVIDWANASRGDALFDIGVTYVLLTCPVMPGRCRVAHGRETDPRVARACVHRAVPRSASSTPASPTPPS